MSKYPLIIFEGIEGTGKTTQINNLTNFLNKNKYKYVKIREPGGTKNSEKIRKLILNKKSTLNKITDLFLYLASRSENLEKIIAKNYGKKIILIDRFIYSTLAYQHYGMNINKKLINYLNNFLVGRFKPNYIFLLTVDKKTLIKRLSKRKNKNKYDRLKINFYMKVQNGYLKLLKNKKNLFLINSCETLKDNKETIINKIKQII
tara:strand:- start:111 stop:722 length:612 start_codon:yes stop_codon:yes gene_type:complete